MIGAATATRQTDTISWAARTARPPDMPLRTASIEEDDGVTVDLSPAGKLLTNLPPLILDPAVHMRNAETRLTELMSELGIPPGTEINIDLSSAGQFTVEGDHDKLAELEQKLNDGSEMDLRNSLIGAHSGSMIQRIATAARETQLLVEANPKTAKLLWNQLLATADRIKSQSMDFAFSGGALTGTFADGTEVAIA
ncbi:MAG: hypothetical protein KKH72_12825 [Alphaproteobacteria bacterium]|nr:hypothetical protein [Alphaproteobacteria bacterium]